VFVSVCLQGRNKSRGLYAEMQSGRVEICSLSTRLSSCFCGGSVEGCHILLAEAGEFSYSYLADLYGRGGVGVFWSVSVIRPVAPGQYSSLQVTIIWIHTDWSQFLCYSRVGKVRQFLQARNSPLCGTLFRS